MEVILFNEPKLPDFTIKSVIKVFTIGKNKPKVYLGKILLSDNGRCYFMSRFLKEQKLQTKFYKKFNQETAELFRLIEKSNDKNELISNCMDKFDLMIIDDYTLEDIYTDVDIGDKEDYLSVNIPVEKDTGKTVNDEDSLILANEIDNELEETIRINDLKEEEVKEAYKRKGFRKDAKSQLVPIKIVRKDGIQATYYVKASKLEEYTKKNKVVNGRWKYEFYTDKVEKSMRNISDLGLNEHLDGFVKSGNYGTPTIMSGLNIMIEKYLDGLGIKDKKPIRNLLKDRNFLHERLTISNNLEASTRINFKNRKDYNNGTSIKDIEIISTVFNNGKKLNSVIQGSYTRKPKGNRIYNSFHINFIKGTLSKDQIAYMTDAHIRTHDMISIKVDGIENKGNIRKFLMSGYNWNKDTIQNFRKYKETLLDILKQQYGEDSLIYKKMKAIFDKSKTLREAQLELYKTGNKNLVNKVFKTGIFEEYGKLTNSDRLQFRSYTLRNATTTNEKILETFEVLRDPNNDYHLGKEISGKIEDLDYVNTKNKQT